MARRTRLVTVLALTGALALAAGCGEPNDPAGPSGKAGDAYELVGSVPVTGFPRGLDMSGSTLVVAENSCGLAKYDISDLSNPVRTGDHIRSILFALDVAIVKPFDVFIASYSDGSKAMELDNFSLRSDSPVAASGNLRGHIAENRLRRATVSSKWVIYDEFNDPHSIPDINAKVVRVVRSDFDDGIHVGYIYPDSSNVNADNVPHYVFNYGDEIELAAAQGRTAGFDQINNSIDTIAVCLGEAGVGIADVSEATETSTNPKENGEWLSYISTPGESFDCAYQNGYIYVAAGMEGLVIVNAQNLNDIRFVKSWSMDGLDHAHKIAVHENVLALLDRYDGALLFDISDPENPIHKGTYEARETKAAIFDQNGNLFIGSEEKRLEIIKPKF